MVEKIEREKLNAENLVPCGKWFHLVQRSNLLRCKGLWGLRCCRSVWGVWSFHTSSDLRRSWLLWLFFFSLSSCCSLSPSTWVVSSPTSSPNSKGSSSNLSKNTTLDQIRPNNVKPLLGLSLEIEPSRDKGVVEVAKLAHLVDLGSGFVAGEWSEIGGDLT